MDLMGNAIVRRGIWIVGVLGLTTAMVGCTELTADQGPVGDTEQAQIERLHLSKPRRADRPVSFNSAAPDIDFIQVK
jgi:hypothetical protein